MNNSKLNILPILLLIGLIIPQISMGQKTDDSQKKISCKEALKNVHLIKVGMKEFEIIDLIGTTTTKSFGNIWNYSFWECSTLPKAGMQSIIGVSLVFRDEILTKIDYATICAMGMANPSKQKKKSNKFRQNKGGND